LKRFEGAFVILALEDNFPTASFSKPMSSPPAPEQNEKIQLSRVLARLRANPSAIA